MTTGDHPGEQLSAYADGELVGSERASLHAHLIGCEACRNELHDIATARAVVRQLPPVDLPDLVVARVRRVLRRRRPALAAAAVGVAAAGAVAWGASPPQRPVQPQMANLISFLTPAGTDRGVAASLTSSPLGRSTVHMPPAYRAPDSLAGGFTRLGAVRAGRVTYVVYTDGSRTLSVMTEAGHLGADAIPNDARPVQVGGSRAFAYRWNGSDAVAWQAGPVIHMVVGPADEVLVAASAMAPPPPPPITTRVRRASRALVEALTP